MVYTSSSLALAHLEMRVHLRPRSAPTDHVAIEIAVPEDVVHFLDVSTLPHHWRAYPAPGSLARFGDTWVHRATSVALAVPSAIVPEERNILLNPEHPKFSRIATKTTKPIVYDSRLFSVEI